MRFQWPKDNNTVNNFHSGLDCEYDLVDNESPLQSYPKFLDFLLSFELLEEGSEEEAPLQEKRPDAKEVDVGTYKSSKDSCESRV